MNWFVELRRFAASNPALIGPGRLILVVGPSGAGKDTLINGAKCAYAEDPSVIFPQRVVTRPPSPAENNAAVSEQDFNQLVADGRFAMWWEAHGNRYGIPASIDDDIRAGRVVICNASRTIVRLARRRYQSVSVVLVTAPRAILEERLAYRKRSSDGHIENRLTRLEEIDVAPDFVINNVRRAAVGIRRFSNIIREGDYFILS